MEVLATSDGGDQYITAAKIKATFGICSSTLRNWAQEGKVSVVRFGGNDKRLYHKGQIEGLFRGYRPKSAEAREAVEEKKIKVCYARVSSAPQRDDLERQVKDLEQAYPGHEIVRDVGSGINWKRPGLISILDRAMRGDIQEVVVAHRDRLCRFAFELLEHVLVRSGCKIVVQHQDDVTSNERELKDDLLAILTVFVASNNGRRAAANKRARRAREQAGKGETKAQKEGESGRGTTTGKEGDQMQEVDPPPDQSAKEDTQVMD